MTATNTSEVLVEAAVETVAAAQSAARAGADRLELCADLSVGGLTPHLSLVEEVCNATPLPVMVMIRPRAGDFVYSDDEVRRMEQDIRAIHAISPAGIVTGVLRHGAEIHTVPMQRLLSAAEGLPVTFHRAFDRLSNPAPALEELIALGVRSVLTSGGASSASAGVEVIATLVRQARERITIIAGGGVRAHNVGEVIERTGVREVHARFENEEQILNLVWAVRNRSARA